MSDISSSENESLKEGIENRVARIDADVESRFKRPFYDRLDCYEIYGVLGTGKYSNVFLATDAQNNELVVVKVLNPISKENTMREVKVLSVLKDCPHIVSMIDSWYSPIIGRATLVFKHAPITATLSDIALNLTGGQIKRYMYQLLIALNCCHSRKIMHRDVKTSNIIIDENTGALTLIDFGMAEFYEPGDEYNIYVSSKPYKAPELIIGVDKYGPSIDIWSAGCVLAGMIFRLDYLFAEFKDSFDYIVQIASILGFDKFIELTDRYDIEVAEEDIEKLKPRCILSWKSLINKNNESLCTNDAIDLLSRMVVWMPDQRITAKEAMKHQYFDEVRDIYELNQ